MCWVTTGQAWMKPCTRCKAKPALEGRERCAACAAYARRWHESRDEAPPVRRPLLTSARLRPVAYVGEGVSLGLEVVTFRVLA